MTREDGSELEVEMIRPTSFWQQQGAVPGAQVFMEFPELEVSTHATVRKVQTCPPIAEGSGNVVTARIVTLTAADLVDVELETGETIAGTPPHPIWSVEEEDWVELGDLEVGDFVLTDDGPIEVVSVDYRTTAETVYNVEVHGHHIYQIGDAGVLVHNSILTQYAKAPKGGYLNPGIGSAAKGQIFNHAWIKHDLFNNLRSLVGKADANKFLAALKKGVVGSTNQSGIKIFSSPVGKYTHELKISGSAQRLLGYIDENGVLIFDKFVRGGLH